MSLIMSRSPVLARAGAQSLFSKDRGRNLINAGDGNIYDADNERWLPPNPQAPSRQEKPPVSYQEFKLAYPNGTPEEYRKYLAERQPLTFLPAGPDGKIMAFSRSGLGGPPRGVDTGSAAPPSPAQQRITQEAAVANKRKADLEALINEAQAILPYATSSGVGALVDTALNWFGQSTDSGDAASRLDTIGGWMLSNVPRLEGPQGEKDRELYREMAAKVGNRNLAVSQRLSALDSLRTINSRASFTPARQAAPRAPERIFTMEEIDAEFERRGLTGGR
jgi:hypothetical protein